MEGRKEGWFSDGVACERRLPRICYGPIAIVSPIYEFHCDTAAHPRLVGCRCLVGLQCIRECVYNVYLLTVLLLLFLHAGERQREGERKSVVLCKRRPDAGGGGGESIDCILSVHTVMLPRHWYRLTPKLRLLRNGHDADPIPLKPETDFAFANSVVQFHYCVPS